MTRNRPQVALLYIFSFIGSLPLLTLVLLKEDCLIDLYDTFQKVLAPILGLGALAWIAHLLGYDLPYQDISFGGVENSHGELVAQYTFQNHYLYLANTSWMMNVNADIPAYFRFSSIFLEPGYTAIFIINSLPVCKFRYYYTTRKINHK